MSKTDFISKVAEKAGLSKVDAKKAVDAVLGSIEESLAAGEKVQFVGFGTFDVSARKARKGRNPRTGEEIKIAAKKVPIFRAGKKLKDAVE